jgi:hypothetical protein
LSRDGRALRARELFWSLYVDLTVARSVKPKRTGPS